MQKADIRHIMDSYREATEPTAIRRRKLQKEDEYYEYTVEQDLWKKAATCIFLGQIPSEDSFRLLLAANKKLLGQPQSTLLWDAWGELPLESQQSIIPTSCSYELASRMARRAAYATDMYDIMPFNCLQPHVLRNFARIFPTQANILVQYILTRKIPCHIEFLEGTEEILDAERLTAVTPDSLKSLVWTIEHIGNIGPEYRDMVTQLAPMDINNIDNNPDSLARLLEILPNIHYRWTLRNARQLFRTHTKAFASAVMQLGKRPNTITSDALKYILSLRCPPTLILTSKLKIPSSFTGATLCKLLVFLNTNSCNHRFISAIPRDNDLSGRTITVQKENPRLFEAAVQAAKSLLRKKAADAGEAAKGSDGGDTRMLQLEVDTDPRLRTTIEERLYDADAELRLALYNMPVEIEPRKPRTLRLDKNIDRIRLEYRIKRKGDIPWSKIAERINRMKATTHRWP